jgi:hypothetical protein
MGRWNNKLVFDHRVEAIQQLYASPPAGTLRSGFSTHPYAYTDRDDYFPSQHTEAAEAFINKLYGGQTEDEWAYFPLEEVPDPYQESNDREAALLQGTNRWDSFHAGKSTQINHQLILNQLVGRDKREPFGMVWVVGFDDHADGGTLHLNCFWPGQAAYKAPYSYGSYISLLLYHILHQTKVARIKLIFRQPTKEPNPEFILWDEDEWCMERCYTLNRGSLPSTPSS